MDQKGNGNNPKTSSLLNEANLDDPPSPAEPEWKNIFRTSLTQGKAIAARFDLDPNLIKTVIERYPARINSYYLSLIKEKNDPIYKQCIPTITELEDNFGEEDPLHEDAAQQARPNVPDLLTHRYPDRILFRVSNKCAMYCRFCTRKRKVGDPLKQPTWPAIREAFAYIEKNKIIRDVILSGGDPLLLSDAILEQILSRLHKILHDRPNSIIRVGSRIPCALPQRVTPELCLMLRRYHPLYLNTHFNHPAEITLESRRACELLADAGIPLGNQTVLLKGVNDNPIVMKELMQGLLSMRVRPYYIYQADPVKGTNHFRTKVSRGIEIYKALRGHTSGLAVPAFVIDAPGGGGKIPLLPEYVKEKTPGKIVLRNYEDKEFIYPDTATDN